MPATSSGDIGFIPQVANDHIQGYFNDHLVMGAFAQKNTTLKDDAKAGETITMPFYKTIGAVEKPGENDSLTVDKLEDSSFSATVAEVGKAVGFKDAALIKNGDSKSNTYEEATRQIGRVQAEAVDNDLITEATANGNFELGYQAGAAGDVCNVQNLLRGKITGFGDKESEAQVLILHSQHIITFGVELFTKMLVKDANDPYNKIPGFKGRILDMAVVVTDKMPRVADVGGKRVFSALILKADAYGFIVKQDMLLESDRDILARETVIAATQWYAVKAFHGKVSANDKRICKMNFATEMAA